LKSLAEWNNDRSSQGKEHVGVGIGIHYGKVIAGALGDETRVAYTVIGDAVNVAERIEGLTRTLPSSLIISKALYDQAQPLSGKLDATLMADVKLKGRINAIDLYGLSNQDPSVREFSRH